MTALRSLIYNKRGYWLYDPANCARQDMKTSKESSLNGPQSESVHLPLLRLIGSELLIGPCRMTLGSALVPTLRRVLNSPNKVIPLVELRSGVNDAPTGEFELVEDITRINRLLDAIAPGTWCIAHFPGEGLMLACPDRVQMPSLHRIGEFASPVPDQPDRLIGREEAIRSLTGMVRERRLVSIVGSGGMGKTSLAIAVARKLASDAPDGLHFIDLSRHRFIDSAIRELALVFDAEPPAENALPALLRGLRGQRLLLVLDGCEVAISAAAALAESLTSAGPGIFVLATSREPLSAAGEWIHRIQPLACPLPDDALPTWLTATYPALQLFAKTAGSGFDAFRLDPRNIEIASDICRRLDGNPLAISLAASRVASLGIERVAEQLDQKMLGWTSSSPLDPRHQSLEAVLDWSYQLLESDEQDVFQALSIFRSQFDLDAAMAVTSEPDQGEIAAVILDLAEKSLLSTQHCAGRIVYRLLDTTRSYAKRVLAQSGTAHMATVRSRHARFLLHLLNDAEQQWLKMERSAWRLHYGAWIEDVRDALSWAFDDAGDAVMGAELTAVSLALANQTGLMPDYARFAERSLEIVRALQPPRLDLAIKLHAFPALRQMTVLQDQPRKLDTLKRAVDLAQIHGDVPSQIASSLALWAHSFQAGQYRHAANWTARIRMLADIHSDTVADITARRTWAQVQHFQGNHAGSRLSALEVCAGAQQPLPLAYIPSPVSLDVSMRILLTRIHWIEGHAEQAWATVNECLAIAQADHPMSVCQALGLAAIPLAFWCGQSKACCVWIEQLHEQALRFSHEYWAAWARLSRALLNSDDSPIPMAAWETLQKPEQTKFRDHACTFRWAGATSETYERVVRQEVGWCGPEVLRIQAERIVKNLGLDALVHARSLLEQAMNVAREQGALAWELRCAISNIKLELLAGEDNGGRQLLATVRARFSEGLDSQDLREADHWLSRS